MKGKIFGWVLTIIAFTLIADSSLNIFNEYFHLETDVLVLLVGFIIMLIGYSILGKRMPWR